MISRLTRTTQRLLFRTGTLTEKTMISPRMLQLQIIGDSLKDLPWKPGQHIRLSLSKSSMLLRTYTVRRYDARQGSLDVWIMLHGQSPATAWVNTINPGEEISFLGPTGSFLLPEEEASSYLFVGEETAAVTIQTMLEALPATARVMGCLETRQPGEEIPGSSPHQLPWIYRNGAPAHSSPVLLAAVRSLKLPSTPGIAYLAGEARTCQAIRHYLRSELNWPRTAIHTKAYWTPGKKGLD